MNLTGAYISKLAMMMIFTLFLQTAQSQLISQYSSALPDGRASGHLIYHPESKALLLFNGYEMHLDSDRNDVWKWDGTSWEKIAVSGPGSRSLSAGALNTHTGIIQVFGGIGKEGYEKGKKGDAWNFDGSRWKKIHTNDIGTRDHHKMVYADHLNSFVLYGGLNANREYDTATWILKNNQFTSLNIPGPGPRYHFAMAYDRNRKKIVLYGGGKPPLRDELWEFDGIRWSKITTNITPGGRLRHNLVYSDDLKMVVLHGGYEKTTGWTWGWDGKNWKKIAENGPIGDLQALGYDPVRKVIVAYGGAGDLLMSQLWELKEGKWKMISDNGSWKWVDDKYQKAVTH
jgi:hypothetical protein